MEIFPGNKSEKPYIRKVIEEMKSRYKVDGRTIQVSVLVTFRYLAASPSSSFAKDGKKIKPIFELDNSKLQEDLNLAGYNLIVTSEFNMNPIDIYKTYHNLWKIEESFRITKSYLDARPVFVQKKETIYDHFLICYLSLFLLRILEIKCFKDEINTYDIIEFIWDFRVVDKGDDTYINTSHNKRVNEKIASLTGLSNLDALFLSKNEIQKLFDSTILFSS